MKHYYFVSAVLAAFLSSGSWAAVNSDPAAGAESSKPVVKAVPTARRKAAPAPSAVRTVTPATRAASTEKTPDNKRQIPLEEQLKALNVGNQIPVAANREKLYAVQERNLPLRWKSEVSVGAGSNLTGDSFLRTQQLEAGYHLHINDRWSVGLGYAWVDNQFKSDATNLKNSNNAIPDVPYAKTRADLTVEYNLFYGKFRWSADSVSYFDQYIALGPTSIEQNTGTTTGAVADVGFAFWLGKWGSTRLGLKDYYYKEEYRSGAEMTNNIHAHLDIGYIF